MWICSIVFYPHVYCPLLTVKSILFVILYDIQMFDDGMQEILLPDKEVEKEGENIMEANSGHLMIEEKNRLSCFTEESETHTDGSCRVVGVAEDYYDEGKSIANINTDNYTSEK